MKIAIIGNAGSGKSTLGLILHKKLKIPLYHLDQYYWKPNWQESDYNEFEKIHNALCNHNSWIIEGMNTRILEYRIKVADVVRFLDFPRYICFYRMFKRTFKNWGQVTFSGAQGCPERLPNVKFLKFICNFKYKQRKKILETVDQYKNSKQIFIIQNKKELTIFLENIDKIFIN